MLSFVCLVRSANIYLVKYDEKVDFGSDYCEAQGKGRAKGRPREVTQRSFIDGGWWMVVKVTLWLVKVTLWSL